MSDQEVVSSVPFKLKDKKDRNFKVFDLHKMFGFKPDIILVSKPPKKTSTFILHAVKPK